MGVWLRGDWFHAGTNGVGVLLLHGFSGEPSELMPLADGLVAHGFSVSMPILHGHGGAPHDLDDADHTAWLNHARRTYHQMRQECERVILIGFSMGGMIASILAHETPPDALVILAMPTYLMPEWAMRYVGRLRYVMPWLKPFAKANFADPAVRRHVLHRDPELDLDCPEVQRFLRNHIRLPIKALGELVHLMRAARHVISAIQTPTFIGHGTQDETAYPHCATELARKLPNLQQLQWYKHSDHLLFAGDDTPQIVADICEFCLSHVPQMLEIGMKIEIPVPVYRRVERDSWLS